MHGIVNWPVEATVLQMPPHGFSAGNSHDSEPSYCVSRGVSVCKAAAGSLTMKVPSSCLSLATWHSSF